MIHYESIQLKNKLGRLNYNCRLTFQIFLYLQIWETSESDGKYTFERNGTKKKKKKTRVSIIYEKKYTIQ